MDLCKPFLLKDLAKNHQIFIENTHRIYELEKKIKQGDITQEERKEHTEKVAWNTSFQQFLRRTGL